MTEDETVGWHHRLNGHESAQTLGDGEGQASLECCSLQGHKERAGHDLATEQDRNYFLLLPVIKNLQNCKIPLIESESDDTKGCAIIFL